MDPGFADRLRVTRSKRRWYRHPIYQLDYPSVTTVLKAWPDLDGILGKWQRKLAAEAIIDDHDTGQLAGRIDRDGRDKALSWYKAAPDRYRDFAGNRGSIVHHLLADWAILSADTGIPIGDYQPDYHAAAKTLAPNPPPAEMAELEAAASQVWPVAVAAVRKLGLVPYTYRDGLADCEWPVVECPLFNPHEGYAGTNDMFARLNGLGGSLWALDLKTSRSIHDDYSLQAAAYARAPQICFPHPTAPGRWVLRCTPPAERVGILHVTAEKWQLAEVRDVDRAYRLWLQTLRFWQQIDRYADPFTPMAGEHAAPAWADPFDGIDDLALKGA